MDTKHYSAHVIWANDDECYVANCGELPGCIAHGDTINEASNNLSEAIELWIETAEELGRPVPPPMDGKLLGERMIQADQENLKIIQKVATEIATNALNAAAPEMMEMLKKAQEQGQNRIQTFGHRGVVPAGFDR